MFCSVVLSSGATLHLSVFINVLVGLEPLREDSFPADRLDASSLSDASLFSDWLQLWERGRWWWERSLKCVKDGVRSNKTSVKCDWIGMKLKKKSIYKAGCWIVSVWELSWDFEVDCGFLFFKSIVICCCSIMINKLLLLLGQTFRKAGGRSQFSYWLTLLSHP